MKKLTLLVLASCLTAIASRADVIWQETFNYSNGPVSITSTNGTGSTTVSNWITHGGSQDVYVNNRRLEVSTSTAFGGVTTTRSGDINRQFSMTNNSPYTNGQQVIYVSFVVNFTNLPTTNGTYFAHFHVGAPTSTTFEGKLFAMTGDPNQPTNNFAALPKTFRLGVLAGGSGSATANKVFPIDLALNTDYQVVLGWDPVTLAALTLWVNPISSSDVSVTTGDPFTPSLANIVNSFAFRQAGNFGAFLTVSNLVVATTYDEAVTNVLATNAVAPRFAYPLLGLTNFVGANVVLSAVAVGQGLGSLTYDWFKESAPFANPAGNANALAFANAQVSDSGNYTLVVTTPYGLSITSAIVKVLISSAPVPPAFVTQPASQTAYRGQNVLLSTTVSSPGNVTYQWFSNNVAIAGANASTLQLDNVATNFSASYKVSATNDVVANGIVSSNAVLTVLNPPHVSVGFLRTLVDPVTFVPTASPTQPYEVTGTITTYTNITTGNTASYFLQDGTGGINIFATFGSTFRPAQGDIVTYVGVLSSFTSGLELIADTTTRSYTSYSVISSGNPLPTPKSIPFSLTNTSTFTFINTNLAGSLVKLSNVYFGALAGTTISTTINQTVVVTNAAGESFNVNFFNLDLDTAGQTLPDFATSVTGVLYGFHPNYSLAVTKFSDIVAGTPTPPAIPLGLSISAGTLTFTWTDPSFSLQSATNVAGPYIDIPGATTGFITNGSASGLSAQFFRLYHP